MPIEVGNHTIPDSLHDYEFWILGPHGWLMAAVCTALSVGFSLFLIYKHLRNFTNPRLQLQIIRILLMVPIYSIDSFLSLLFVDLSLVWDLLRDCYEAFCIYSFFVLIVNYVGSCDEEVAEILEDKPEFKQPFPLFFLKVKPGRKFLRRCHQYILQFVFIKPFVSFAALAANLLNVYGDGDFSPRSAWLWLTIIDNISITLSLWYLVLYYIAAKTELKPFHPVGKFLCIKAVVFFSFWQGVALAILGYFGLVAAIGQYSSESVSRSLQDFIICFEMFIIAIVHHKVFGYSRFSDPDKVPFLYNHDSHRVFSHPSQSIGPVIKNFVAVTSVKDVLEDTKRSFLHRMVDPEAGGILDTMSFGNISTTEQVSENEEGKTEVVETVATKELQEDESKVTLTVKTTTTVETSSPTHGSHDLISIN